MSDPLVIAGQEFQSRLFLGTAGYPNRKIMLDAIAASGTAMVTASIRRISLAGDDESLIELLAGRVRFLPNTAGCQTAKDAVLTAELAREALDTNWVKLEVIGDRELLYPDVEELIRAMERLVDVEPDKILVVRDARLLERLAVSTQAVVDARRLDLEVRENRDAPVTSIDQPSHKLGGGRLVVKNDPIGVDLGVIPIHHHQRESPPLQVFVKRPVVVAMVGKDDDALDVAGDRLFDVLFLVVVGVERADHLQIAVVLGGGPRDAHEDLEEVRVVQHVADERD